MAKMNEPKTMRKASSRSCFFVVGAVGIVYEVDVSLTKIIPLVDSAASRREIPTKPPDEATGSDMTSPLKLYYLAPNVILLSLKCYITFH